MKKTLYVVRHGNTFDKGDVVRRVGGRTDIPLSNSGQIQAAILADVFDSIALEACFSSPLKRTMQTAEAICGGHKVAIQNAEFLREIDYGPDENRPEIDVIERIGAQTIKDWDERTIVPDGWSVDPNFYRQAWADFIDNIQSHNTLVVTSNGVARFLLDALSVVAEDRKMKTGSVSRFAFNEGKWTLDYWGIRPPLP